MKKSIHQIISIPLTCSLLLWGGAAFSGDPNTVSSGGESAAVIQESRADLEANIMAVFGSQSEDGGYQLGVALKQATMQQLQAMQSAADMDAVIIPDRGVSKLSSLVIKASAGTIFKSTIVEGGKLAKDLSFAQRQGIKIAVLSSHASENLFQFQRNQSDSVIYVLGNESDGVSGALEQLADYRLSIPMHNGVESLNVAVTAALVAFHVNKE